MSEKFRNRFRISTSRAKWWDYGNGSYFITICTRNRIHFFGEVIDTVMLKTPIGEIAEKYWKEIPDKYPFAKLGVFVIMPNHMHGIINISGTLNESRDLDKEGIDSSENNVENDYVDPSKIKRGGMTGIYNPMLYQNLGRVIRWYTGRVSFEAHKIVPEFNWQRRFNEQIIRDEEEYEIKIRYIQNNPLKWKEDEFYCIKIHPYAR